MKTIEEMREELLAYCQSVCSPLSLPVELANGLEIVFDNDNYEWELSHRDGSKVTYFTEISESTDAAGILLAYCLMGLQARDAVEAERVELIETFGQMKMQIENEHARSAALVEAVQEAHTEIAVNNNRIQAAFILNSAIESNKKGAPEG